MNGLIAFFQLIVPSFTNSVPWDRIHWPKPLLITGPGKCCLSLSSGPLQFPASVQSCPDKSVTPPIEARGHLTLLFLWSLLPADPACSLCFWGQPPGQFCVVCAMFPEAMSVRAVKLLSISSVQGQVSCIPYPAIPVTLGQESLPRQWSEEETN